MAKGDTKTNQYLDIAANGTRADLPTDTCCETRSQTLIREVAERIMDVEDEVEEIKNNPDVVDIVPTYAALQNYDTSGLTDKDIIRVLADETHDGDSTYYRYNAQSGTWTYVGESKQYEDFVGTDGTAGGQNGLVPAPVATDAGKFLNANGSWEEVQAGSVTELTTADYNYPTSNPTQVSLHLLDSGFYTWGSGVAVRAANSGDMLSPMGVAIVDNPGDTSNKKIWVLDDGSSELSARYSNLLRNYTVAPSGVQLAIESALTTNQVVNNLASTRQKSPLSANQGRVLKDLIDSIAVRGAGAPTTSTVGQVGTLYEDTTNGDLYICTDATNPYVWEEVGSGGGGGPTVVQTTGTSTTDVMSQNATTSMVYADPASRNKLQLGKDAVNMGANSGDAIGHNAFVASGTTHALAVGYNAAARATNSVAIGSQSNATAQGEVSIGNPTRTDLYNNTGYRLLTGLYDPQSAHDAATKGYVDGLISALEARIAALEGN